MTDLQIILIVSLISLCSSLSVGAYYHFKLARAHQKNVDDWNRLMEEWGGIQKENNNEQ